MSLLLCVVSMVVSLACFLDVAPLQCVPVLRSGVGNSKGIVSA